jgi:hypothetical protein
VVCFHFKDTAAIRTNIVEITYVFSNIGVSIVLFFFAFDFELWDRMEGMDDEDILGEGHHGD